MGVAATLSKRAVLERRDYVLVDGYTVVTESCRRNMLSHAPQARAYTRRRRCYRRKQHPCRREKSRGQTSMMSRPACSRFLWWRLRTKDLLVPAGKYACVLFFLDGRGSCPRKEGSRMVCQKTTNEPRWLGVPCTVTRSHSLAPFLTRKPLPHAAKFKKW